MHRRTLLGFVALIGCGCGYVGEPLPPLLNIPERVSDLRAVQRGRHLIVQFSLPRLTTEGVVLRQPVQVDLRAGAAAPGPLNANAWESTAKPIEEVQPLDHQVSYTLSATEWTGKEIILGVRTIGPSGRASAWSNFVPVEVVPPPEVPSDVRVEPVPSGVRVSWQGGGSFIVFRRDPGVEKIAEIARVEKPEWVDTGVEYGKTYFYAVQKIVPTSTGSAESQRSVAVDITPIDRFAPAVPSGLRAIASTSSIELTWERVTETDLAGYRLYRSIPGQDFQLLAGDLKIPAYSDRQAAAGKSYRYAVTSVDASGNESAMSSPVSVTVP